MYTLKQEGYLLKILVKCMLGQYTCTVLLILNLQLTDADGDQNEPHEHHKAEVAPTTQATDCAPGNPSNDVRERETLRHVLTIDWVEGEMNREVKMRNRGREGREGKTESS